MPVDFGSFKKLEGLPALHRAKESGALDRLLILLKLRKGYAAPDYVEARGDDPVAPGFLSAIVGEDQLPRLNADPAVHSFSITRRLPAVE